MMPDKAGGADFHPLGKCASVNAMLRLADTPKQLTTAAVLALLDLNHVRDEQLKGLQNCSISWLSSREAQANNSLNRMLMASCCMWSQDQAIVCAISTLWSV